MDHNLPVSPWPEWEIIAKIGEGSYGSVYKAARSEKGHAFYSAIKVISIPQSREELNIVMAETGDEHTARLYFENVMQDCIKEVSLMENFRGNSHIVSVEDYKVTEYLDEIGWDIFIRMEYLVSFPEYSAGKSYGKEEILALGKDICKALRYLDRLQIVHRDIKPENIFVSRFGDYKLGDFGIARKLERSVSGLSQKGTWSYMAPEVYHGETCDARSDIYSLGIVLYRMMNNNRLPLISTTKQLITYHDKEEALSRRMAGEALPPPVQADGNTAAIILKACAFDPSERYQKAEDMLEDLRRASGEHREGVPQKEESRTEADAGREKKEKRTGTRRENGDKRKKTGTDALKRKKHVSSRQDGGNGFRKVVPWAAAMIAMAVIITLLVGSYIRKMLVDTVREQTEQMLSSIESRSTVPVEDTGQDFASSIELISERATAIVNELPEDKKVGTEGEVLKYYNAEGELRKVLVYPDASAEGLYEEYYYWNGDLFFAYIWDMNGEEMYYYRDGILIRWIDRGGNVHDNEHDNAEYNARGDKYWINSILQKG